MTLPDPTPAPAPADTTAEIAAAARRLAKAVKRAETYGGSFAAQVPDRLTALCDLVGLPEDWDTGPHTDDAEPTVMATCAVDGCAYGVGHTQPVHDDGTVFHGPQKEG